MNVVAALAVGIAVGCALLAVRGPSQVERRLRQVRDAPSDRRALVRAVARMTLQRGRDGDRVAMLKVVGALIGTFVGLAASVALGWGVIVPAVAGYAGFVLPSLVVDRRATRDRVEAERAAVSVVEWLHALVACGRPLEPALLSVASHATGSVLLDECLARVRRDYTLGVPMHASLARNGAESRVGALVELGSRCERARDLGRGVLGLLQDLRDELRATERAKVLEAASQVEGKLTLVLTLCYLPALALLVIVPLFLTIIANLFAA